MQATRRRLQPGESAMNLSLRSIAGREMRASASAGGSLATERRLHGMSDCGRRCARLPLAGLRGYEPQLPRQPDGQDQLPPVAGASHFAARLDVPPRDGNPYTVHVADEDVMVAERLDVLDLDQVVIFHGGPPSTGPPPPPDHLRRSALHLSPRRDPGQGGGCAATSVSCVEPARAGTAARGSGSRPSVQVQHRSRTSNPIRAARSLRTSGCSGSKSKTSRRPSSYST